MKNAHSALTKVTEHPKLGRVLLLVTSGMLLCLVPERCAAQLPSECITNLYSSGACQSALSAKHAEWERNHERDSEIERKAREDRLKLQEEEASLAASAREDLIKYESDCLLNSTNQDPYAAAGAKLSCDQVDRAYRQLNDYEGLARFQKYECHADLYSSGCDAAAQSYLHLGMWIDKDVVNPKRNRFFVYGSRDRVGPEQNVSEGLAILGRMCVLTGHGCDELGHIFEAGLPQFKGKYDKILGHSLYYPTKSWAVAPDPARALAYYEFLCPQTKKCEDAEAASPTVSPQQLASATESLVREGLLPKTQVLSLSSLGSEVKIKAPYLNWEAAQNPEKKDMDAIHPAGLGYPSIALYMVPTQDCDIQAIKRSWSEPPGKRPDYVPLEWEAREYTALVVACLPLSGKALHALIDSYALSSTETCSGSRKALCSDSVHVLLGQIGMVAEQKDSPEAKAGNSVEVQKVPPAGADVDSKDKDGVTALMRAAIHGQTDTVRALLEKGADANAKDNTGSTALMNAASFGSTDAVRALLQKGADVNAKTNYGQTALMRAADYGQTQVARILLENGADPNVKDNQGRTALFMASDQKHPDIVALLKSAGAKE